MLYDIDDIKRINRYKGGHFFEPKTMRFFDSRVLSTVYQGPGGVYFLTSERFHGSTVTGPRLYTVRYFNPETGDCGTLNGVYNELTKTAAVRIAEAAAAVPIAEAVGA